MKKRKDILLSDNNDLLIEHGDFVIGESDTQHVNHIVMVQPGEFKETPQLGFGVINYLKSLTTKTKFKRNLRVHLNFDGYRTPKIDLGDGFKDLKIEV